MKKTLVSELAIRELVREAFETPPPFDMALVKSQDELPVIINPSTDDSLASVELTPVDVQFVPHSKVEFAIAIKQMAKGLPDEVIPMLYAKVREVMMDAQAKCSGPEDQGDTEEMEKRENSRLGMEESIRKAIREMIKESRPMNLAGHRDDERFDDDDFEVNPGRIWDPEAWETDVNDDEFEKASAQHAAEVERDEDEFGGLSADTSDVDAETSSEWDPEPAPAPVAKKINRKESETGYGVEGDQLRKIAAELGISASGAKRLMTTGLGKLKYMSDLSDADVKDIVHGAARDWVEKLVDQDRLSDAEGRTWLRHLDIVAQNDEFRDFLHDYVRDEMKKDDEWVYDTKEEK